MFLRLLGQNLPFVKHKKHVHCILLGWSILARDTLKIFLELEMSFRFKIQLTDF